MKYIFFDILNFKFKSLAGWQEFWRLSGTDVLVGGFLLEKSNIKQQG